ncbi:MAG: glycosyltransferase family 9 protein [Opitutaceae bacterium]
MQKILVLRGGALGDFLVTLPALAALRARWPGARLELAGNATAAQLARSRGLLDAVHSQHEARWSSLYSGNPLPAAFAEWLASFDLVLNFWPDPDEALRRSFPLQSEQVFLSAGAHPTCAPAAAHYCAPLKKLGIEVHEFCFQIAAPRPTARLALHPGSGSSAKNWPLENWRALLATLPGPVSIILGDAENSAWQKMALPSGVEKLVNSPLETVVHRLTECRLFLGHDSGISHLAAACGVPSLLLFGPTDPAIWAPPTPRTHVLRRGPSLDSISIAEVQTAVAARLVEKK